MFSGFVIRPKCECRGHQCSSSSGPPEGAIHLHCNEIAALLKDLMDCRLFHRKMNGKVSSLGLSSPGT